MKKKYFLSSTIVLIVMLSIACSSPETSLPNTPDIGIQGVHFNQNLHITLPKPWNSFKIDKQLTMSIEIINDFSVAFKPNYGAIIYALQEDKWVRVQDFNTYPDAQDVYIILRPAKGDSFETGSTSVYPVLDDKSKPVILRIILVGNLIKDGKITDEQVAGTVDVKVFP